VRIFQARSDLLESGHAESVIVKREGEKTQADDTFSLQAKLTRASNIFWGVLRTGGGSKDLAGRKFILCAICPAGGDRRVRRGRKSHLSEKKSDQNPRLRTVKSPNNKIEHAAKVDSMTKQKR